MITRQLLASARSSAFCTARSALARAGARPPQRLLSSSPLRLSATWSPPPRSRLGRWRFPLILGALIVTSYTAFVLYFDNNFPPEVAALLRKGLWAETKNGGQDYKLALKYYLEAWAKAEELGLSPISDEYTGLQIKVAELYERLGQKDEALDLYREMGVTMIQALTANQVPKSSRKLLILRDLRVAMKCAMQEGIWNPQLARMGLMMHIAMAQNELADSSEELAKYLKPDPERTDLNPVPKDPGSLVMEVDFSKTREQKEVASTSPWFPYRDELFAAREMFAALSLAAGDSGVAYDTLNVSLSWMTLAHCEIANILMTIYNAAAISYRISEQFELRDYRLKTNAGVGPEADALTPDELETMAKEALKQSKDGFQLILNLIDKLPGSHRRQDLVIEVQALSTYSLGVVALHNRQYDKASDLLREARLRAKGCKDAALLKSVEEELTKLDTLDRTAPANLEHNASLLDVQFIPRAIELSGDDILKK